MLTQKAIDSAKPKDKIYRISDQNKSGLCLEITPEGGKRWRLRYRFEGKPKMISLGLYPAVRLADAREKAQEARKKIESGIDPAQERKEESSSGKPIFSEVAREWWEKFLRPNGGKYPEEAWRRLGREAFPFIGKKTLDKIDAPAVLALLRRIEGRGTIETAHKVKSYISQIMQYGIACGLTLTNPARDLAGALSPRSKKQMAAIIDPREAGALMRSICGYEGSLVVRCAMKIGALTFVRPGELRSAEWAEVDMAAAEWRIPAEKMKMKRPHIVPLARQTVEVLQELSALTGHSIFLFPSIRTGSRPMSDMTVNAALRAMGYSQDKMTGHGFRAMASSLLAEQGWGIDAIERQLAHVEKNKVRAAYHRSEHLDERRKMMQFWADYLDSLRLAV